MKEENNIKNKDEYFYLAKKLPNDLTIKQTVYIPVYSHVYTSEDKYERMGITLSVRNTNEDKNIWIDSIIYFNTAGEQIETFIDKTHILTPMASIDFIVDLSDMRGGSGANFVLKYSTKKQTSAPIIQAVMVNNSGNRAFSFITDGYTIKK